MSEQAKAAATVLKAELAVVGPVLVLNPDNTVTPYYGRVTLRGAVRALYVQNPDNTLVVETEAGGHPDTP